MPTNPYQPPGTVKCRERQPKKRQPLWFVALVVFDILAIILILYLAFDYVRSGKS
jgi:hypothetical protein